MREGSSKNTGKCCIYPYSSFWVFKADIIEKYQHYQPYCHYLQRKSMKGKSKSNASIVGKLNSKPFTDQWHKRKSTLRLIRTSKHYLLKGSMKKVFKPKINAYKYSHREEKNKYSHILEIKIIMFCLSSVFLLFFYFFPRVSTITIFSDSLRKFLITPTKYFLPR